MNGIECWKRDGMNGSEGKIKWMYNIKLTNSIGVMTSYSKHHVKNSHLHLETISNQEMYTRIPPR